MISYPNQKNITVKKSISNKENIYCIINIQSMSDAMNNLTDKAFKLWCYLNKNQNNYNFYLSKTDALQFGISNKSSYDRSVSELIEKGYLIEKGNNQYIFYENKNLYSE